jgi:hypothetical protein
LDQRRKLWYVPFKAFISDSILGHCKSSPFRGKLFFLSQLLREDQVSISEMLITGLGKATITTNCTDVDYIIVSDTRNEVYEGSRGIILLNDKAFFFGTYFLSFSFFLFFLFSLLFFVLLFVHILGIPLRWKDLVDFIENGHLNRS